MGRFKISLPISKKQLFKLYHRKNRSFYFIAKLFGCSSSTIANRICEYKIPKKSPSRARTIYPKFNFSGNLLEKAYLIGFRLGDLNVYKKGPHSETLVVRCHTTCNDQITLLKHAFNKYGKLTLSKAKDGSTYINCFLNNTFLFLLPKKDVIENWICKNKKYFSSFVAGYVDAEGNFIINQGRARFKIDSYDKGILHQMHYWFVRNNIKSKLRLIGKKGQIRPVGYFFNDDLWRLNINEAHALLKFIYLINPFIKHYKRAKDINVCFKNILKRKKRKTI